MKQHAESSLKSTTQTMPTYDQVSVALESASKRLSPVQPIEYLTNPSRHVALRTWLSIESLPLKPFLSNAGTHDSRRLIWQFHTTANKDRQLNPPQVLVVWLWPEMQLIRIERIGSISKVPGQMLSSDCLMKHTLLPALAALLRNHEPSPTLPPELASAYATLADKSFELGSTPIASTRRRHIFQPASGEYASDISQHEVMPSLKPTDSICEQLGQIAADLRLVTPIATISDVRKLCTKSLFSVAVCGEFSRGKTSLVNSLLGNNTLPTGALPTTQFLTKITYSESERLVWHQRGRPPLTLPASDETWTKLASNLNKEARGVMSVFSSNLWLRNGLEIIDTPGSNESDSGNHQAVFAAIQFADAALVCVSATAPLSLTEQSLIQDHVLIHKIPRVAVVMNFLDQVKSHERSMVIAHARKLLDQIAPHAFLGTNLERSAIENIEGLDFAGHSEIRNLLTSWAKSNDHTSLIQAQVKSLLEISREQGIQDLSNRIQTSKKSRVALEIEIEEKRQALHSKAAESRNLKIEFSQRCEKLTRRIEEVLSNYGEEATERFRYELRTRPDPGTWIREDIGFKLKQELKNAALQVERLIQQSLSGDSQWLARELLTRYGLNLDVLDASVGLDLRKFADETGIVIGDFEDLKKLRNQSRLGAAAVTVVGFFLVGPLVSIVSAGAGVTAEHFIGKRIEQQREIAIRKAEEIVKAAFRDASRIVRERCIDLYKQRSLVIANSVNNWESIGIETINRQIHEDTTTAKHQEDLAKWDKCSSSYINKL